MSTISQIARTTPLIEELPKQESIRTEIGSSIVSLEEIVDDIAARDGPVDVYYWFEGAECLPKKGALFTRENFLAPLYRKKKDATVCLCSLKDWNFKKTVRQMPSFTPVGKAINGLNHTAVRCIFSSDFFRFCVEIAQDSSLRTFVNEELPKKKWLFDLSVDKTKKTKKISELFDNRSTLFDCIKEKDVTAGYSAMQYYEALFLVEESVKRGLSQRSKHIQVCFVLPNDEDKYYRDFPQEIAKMLQLELGEALKGVKIDICFYFFAYGKSIEDRPYQIKYEQALRHYQIPEYFNYLKPSVDYVSLSQRLPSKCFLRDDIHNLNG